ncbi:MULTISPECIES: D-amino acid dehydrogenase [Rhodopseudomonas]|uniref:D-amino acid dehydrogenase n=1 Tax=Rhodopseudomonas palustris TaxID=1076 RepID=A0A0D7DZV8_RHOPL|nr:MULTISPECIES: D-amino acid dehydrogenase [Rhodopseudomonas]KIZ34118.1 amino acid dehydrogenase [Rhodopseudomonas palustris]MDF3812712.1 D-amino acid dehydrogenase [Rhodopseudomonas sp. BAL398]WOK15775.1 D-amino acid dehydrogenase [Rhodopseudomonas sp. BAL398]
MKVLVLGAGVVGVTTAYYLAKAGLEVTVLDRQPGPGLETSFGNAGEVSPGYASPWAGPTVPKKAIGWMLDRHGPLVVRLQADPAMWRWMLQMLRNCTSHRYALNKSRMVGIAEYSRDCLRAMRAETGLAYDERSQGTLQLFRKQSQLDGTGGDIEILKQYNVPYEVLDRAGCVRVEPGLAAVQNIFVGGLRLPDDETGDCHLFTQGLEKIAAGLGVRFVYDTTIKALNVEAGRVAQVTTDKGVFTADRYVMAMGSFSPLLLRPLGIDAPIYPVKGYSITVPIVDAAAAPQSTIMDESYKVAITRLGDRIRVGGTAEVGDYRPLLPPARRGPLDKSLTDLFPKAGDLAGSTFWSGLRPMTPDGPPIVGPTHLPNLHLNTGHGTLGWTMACGTAHVIADQLGGRAPELDVRDLVVSRYASN